MSNKKFIIDTTPSTKIFSFFKKLSYSFENAIAEFIDNSVESFRKNPDIENKSITVIFDAERENIIIRDTAAGISEDKFPRALKLQHVDHDVNGLNEFGMGLKTAGFWLGNKITIHTKNIDESNGWKAVMSLSKFEEKENQIEVSASDSYKKNPILLNGKNDHGTGIIIEEIDKGMIYSQMIKLVPNLASKYRNDISNGLKIRVVLNEKTNKGAFLDMVASYHNDKKMYMPILSYERPDVLDFKYPKIYKNNNYLEREEFDIEIEDNGTIYTANCWIANKEEGTRKDNVGFSLIRRNVVIERSYKPSELFGSGNSFESLRMFGEIIFSPNIPITQAKDKIDWSFELENKLIEKILENESFQKIRRLSKIPRKAENTLNNIKVSDAEKQGDSIRESIGNSAGIKKYEVKKLEHSNKYTKETHESDLDIYVETESGIKRFISRLSEGEKMEDWIKVEEHEDYHIVTMDMNHAFFNPFNDKNNDFIALMRSFSINFALSMLESLESGEDAEEFKSRLGKYLGRKKNEK